MDAFSRNMPDVAERRMVSVSVCKSILKSAGWQDRTIELLFRGEPPKEVQVGNVMLVVS